MNLKEHCIQTASKNLLLQLQKLLLKEENHPPELTEEYELLKTFLSVTDFSELRSSIPELAGGTDVNVVVEFDGIKFTVRRVS